MKNCVRKACIEDVKAIHALLLSASGEGLLLPRSLSQLYSHIRDFFVFYNENNVLVGCGALSVVWENLAEVRSLLVMPTERKSGVGHLLVEACLNEAKQLGIHKVFALTYQLDFFVRQGFSEVSKDVLPQKVWMDCIHCAKFPDCDEIAVQVELD